MREEDWPAVRYIYQEGTDTGHATSEAEASDWDGFDRSRLALHRFVAETVDGRILGWAAVSPASPA